MACVWACALVVLSVCCGSAARAALVVLCAAVAWHLSFIHVVSVPCACQVLRRSDDELMLLLVLLLRVHSIAATIANAPLPHHAWSRRGDAQYRTLVACTAAR